MEGAPSPRPPEAAPELDAVLKSLFDSPNMVFGHGTTPEIAEGILSGGLEAKTFKTAETMVPLFDDSHSFAEQVDQTRHTVLNWEHKGAQAVVIIELPPMPEGAHNVLSYVDSAFEDIEEPHEANRNYRIPARYIHGYIDARTQTLVPNPAFDPTPITLKQRVSAAAIEGAAEPMEVPAPAAGGEDADIF